jgi:NitT/TauT family transport system permease protein
VSATVSAGTDSSAQAQPRRAPRTGSAPRRSSISTAADTPRRSVVLLAQLAILILLLCMWQFLPEIGWLRARSPVFDPFFVSSPQRVFERIGELATGSNGQPLVWKYLWQTLQGTLLGVAIGTALGALFGLVLSNSRRAQPILAPYITVLNAMPRIALIPIFVIIAGASLTASTLTAVAVVFFIVFYNAYAGGRSVPVEMIQNAELLGATPREVMRQIRLPYVLVWTFASLPNAISFGLVAVVTAEILMGSIGMGRLLYSSISTVDSTLTFSVVLILSAVGVILVTLSDALQRRILHWWDAAR